MVPVKHCIVSLSFLAVLWCTVSAVAQNDVTQDPDKVKHRMLEMKKKKLIELLDLKPEQQAPFVAAYEAGQAKIDDAKHDMDASVRRLQKILREGSDPEIAAGTDVLIRSYDILVAMQRERVTALKPLLSVEQYAKLLMFEIRFPEVLQKLIMKRGMFQPDNRKPED